MRRALLAALALLVAAPTAAHAGYGDVVMGTSGVTSYWSLDDAAAPFAPGAGADTLRVSNSGGYTARQPAGIEVGGTSVTLGGAAFVATGSSTTATGRSVEAWISPATLTGNRYVVSRGGTTAANSFHLYLAGDKPVFRVAGRSAVGAVALNANQWQHLVGTLSGTTVSIYVDGQLQDTETLAAAQATSTSSTYVGRPASSTSTSNRFNGGLDEVSVYNRGLSAAEVAAHYAAGLDPTPLTVSFTSGPAEVSDAPDGTIAFAASKGGVSFTCTLDDQPSQACSGSFAYELLRDGNHTLRVEAARRGATHAATYGWRVALPAHEAAPPVTAFTAAPPTLTNSTTASFELAGSKSRLTFACRLDGAAWAACPASGMFGGLPEGRHTLEVRATDRWGAVEETPRSHSWVIDTTPPDTFALAARARRGDPGSVVLGAEAGASFQCRPAEGTWVACEPRFALPVLAVSGQINIRAVDPAGNPDPSPATITVEPAPAHEPILFSGATAGFTVGGARDVSALHCSLDGAPATKCPSPLTFTNLGYGRHTLTITDPNMPGVVFPTIEWTDPLPAPKIVGSQFPAVLQLGSRRKQATLAASRLPRMLFQSNAAGTAKVELRGGARVVRRWTARVVQGSNLVRLPRSAWRRLRAGRYRLVVVVANPAGASTPLVLRFDAVRGTRR